MEPDAVDSATRILDEPVLAAASPTTLLGRLVAALRLRYLGRHRTTARGCDSLYAEEMVAIAQSHDSADLYTLAAEGLMILHRWDFWAPDGIPRPWVPRIAQALDHAIALDSLHVGANHLIIHLHESSTNVRPALPSALRLERLDLGVGHLIHMPAHVFMRLGWYDRAVACNLRAIEADSAMFARVPCHSLYGTGYYPHNIHYLAASASMAGQQALAVEAALKLRSQTDSMSMVNAGQIRMQHAWAYHLLVWTRFSNWGTVLRQREPPATARYAKAMWSYAQGCALVAEGRTKEAALHASVLEAAADSEWARRDYLWFNVPCADVLGVAHAVLVARVAARQGRHERALEWYRRAVTLQNNLAFDEPPDWYYEIEESLGRLLLTVGRPREAAIAFRDGLHATPYAPVGLVGLAESLEAVGKHDEARLIRAAADSTLSHGDGHVDRIDSYSY